MRGTRAGGGGGRSRVLLEGGVFEKAGVNFSEVHGEMSPEFAEQVPGEGRQFTPTGVSLVLHPRNPMVPTVHANFRFLTKGDKQWFGGGADLTPYYPFREDVVHFHQDLEGRLRARMPAGRRSREIQEVVRRVLLPAASRRGARRRRHLLRLPGRRPGQVFAFVRDAGDAFLAAYLPIVRRRKGHALRRARAAVPGVSPRPIRRVQPDLRSRHALRPEDRRAGSSRS